jgi:pimeloyl-ACP methyl ester carboxylesterase
VLQRAWGEGNKDIQHNAILIDSTPEIMLYALDPDEHLVKMPFISGPWPTTSQTISEIRTEFPAPAPYRLVGDVDAALRQDQLNIPQAEAEHMVQPDGMADDSGGEPMTIVWVRWRLHPAQSHLPSGHRPGPVTVTVPHSLMRAGAGYRVIVPYLRGYGTTRFLSSDTPRNGQQSVVAVDIIALMDALKIEKPIFGAFDWGARTACIVAALWPERCKAMVSVSGYLIGSQEAGKMPLPPAAELEWWYQFYFATERGRAGYDKYGREFNKLIWQRASAKWGFDDATHNRASASFDNPDHVAVVIRNYRWRQGLAEGEAKYDDLEKRLAAAPNISVPTITLEGDANGALHADPSTYAKKFTGKYTHRTLTGGIGHNLPQEAPHAFAAAIVDVAKA